MKKSMLIIAAAAATLFAGCEKKEFDVPQEKNTDTYDVLIKVRADETITKGTYNATTGEFTWATGDQIGVNAWITSDPSDHWPQPLDLTAGAGEKEGTFGVSSFDGKTYGGVAFYPWNGYVKDGGGNDLPSYEQGTNIGGDGNLYVHLKSTIDYANASGNPQQLLPLAAQITDNQASAIQFKHLGAGIMVTLKDVPKSANIVRLTIPNKKITGWWCVEPDKIGTSSGVMIAEDGNTSENDLDIMFDQGTTKRDMTFVFPLPTVEDFTTLTIGLYDMGTKLWSKKATLKTAQDLDAGEILKMPDLKVTYEDPEETYYLAGFIGGSDVWTCTPAYKFVNGQLSVVLPDGDNYVILVNGNGVRYTLASYVADGTESIFYRRDGDWQNEKMKVEGGKNVLFQLSDAGYDGAGVHMLSMGYTAFSREWGLYSTTAASWNESFGAVAGSDRNFTMDDDYIYVPETSTSTAKIWKISVNNPADVTTIAAPATPTGYFKVTSARVMDPGNTMNGGNPMLIASNMVMEDGGPLLKLYVYDKGTDTAPSEWTMNSTNTGRRLGDIFTIHGTFANGSFMFKDWEKLWGNGTILVWRTAFDGVPSYSQDPRNPTWNNIKNEGSRAGFYPYPGQTTPQKGIYASTAHAYFVAEDGNNVYTWNAATFNTTAASDYYINAGDFNFFEFKGKRYIAYAKNASKKDGRLIVLEGALTDDWQDILDSKRKVIFQADIQTNLQYADGEYHLDLETESPKESGNSGIGCSVRVIGDEVLIMAGKQNVGLSLFKMTK